MEPSIDQFRLRQLPGLLKSVIFIFTLTLMTGFLAAVAMVETTTDLTTTGIEENYLGNEDNEEAETMRFKKSEYEILNIVHTHILSLSVLFLVLAVLVYFCDIPFWLKSVIIIEPLISLILTFGGMFLLWSGIPGMEYLMYASGIMMVPCVLVSFVAIFWELHFT